MPPRLIEQATDKILSILYDMTSKKFPLSGRGLNLYLFLICEDLPLLRGNLGTPPRTLSYPGPPTRCLWGCVYWPSPVASPRQFYKRKKQNLVKLFHTKPFLQNRDRVITTFFLQDKSEEKIRWTLSYLDTVVLKKRRQNRSNTVLQDNSESTDSVKLKLVNAL